MVWGSRLSPPPATIQGVGTNQSLGKTVQLGAGIHASMPHLSAGALLTVVLGYR